MSELAFEAHDVCVALRGREVLSQVSLSVRQGAFVAVVGPNGSGKTTLLRTLHHAVARQSGTVRVLGRPIESFSRRELGQTIGVLKQERALAFDFLVEELVMMGRSPHKKLLEPDRAEDRTVVEESLRLADVAHLAKRHFATLSGGEKQRVLLARALAQRPSILLLDEPTNHLDIRHQLEVLACVRQLKLTVVAALHDLNLPFVFASDVVLLDGGRVIGTGTPEALLTPEVIDRTFGVSAERLETRDGRVVLAFRASRLL